ncbi:MAG: hypothetical protein KGL10_02710 [Alphaproteobacteria bacterium]|nr:hypothetical protein [Alphaproteobacteria bacterium]MDE2336201.1 hypothetical protein [Alphaproteobacteria bacterium]
MNKHVILALVLAAAAGLSSCASVSPTYHPNDLYTGEDVMDAFHYCQKRTPDDFIGLSRLFDRCMHDRGWERDHPYTPF